MSWLWPLQLVRRLPSQCAVCHAWPSQPVCEACVQLFAQPCARCRGCALPLPPDLATGQDYCGDCATAPPVADAALAAVAYAFPWSKLVVEFKFAQHPGWAQTSGEAPAQTLAYQSWTPDNLCVESFHEETRYYTSRWDALCPYIDVTPEMLETAHKPFLVYALPPEGPYGVPINDKYGLVHAGSEAFWQDERRARKFKDLDKLNKHFSVTEELIAGKDVTADMIFALDWQTPA